MARSSIRSDNRFIPAIGNRADAQQAMKGGAFAAGFVALVNLGIGGYLLLSGAGHSALLGVSGSVVIDGTIFAVLGVFLWRQSIVAAWIGLILFTLEKAWQWTTQPKALVGIVLAVVLWLAFLNALRGALALRQFNREAKAIPAMPDMP
ncbi:hypothetical protein FIV34_06435 [Luteibacter pinisoli]|uniref:Uncharacterized protein n=1 Tax=Luteibacter pinisoli TaxID=2589080 RepID=A0A4Y5Z369_9GAMM|nr:hypothetical protein [Luteibacter pinisoli]QDE38863.1 hypothetical protein FIV34_06435 [Luteibacter pinisoli]